MKYISHRGFNKVAPENSIRSFELAGQQNYWGCETDVCETADGELVAIHDETVDRTTNGTGRVIDMTLAQVRELTIRKSLDLKIPTFREYLEVCTEYSMVPVIEIKHIFNEGTMDNLVATVREFGFEESCIIISFDYDKMEYIRSKSEKIYIQPIIQLSLENVDRVLTLGNAGIDTKFSKDFIDAETVAYAHKHGVKINTYTVNNDISRAYLEELGVDFMTTDSLIK